jgi:hypothetical protein
MSRDDCVPLGVGEAGKSNVSRHAVTIVVSIGRRCKGESNQAALVDHCQWGCCASTSRQSTDSLSSVVRSTTTFSPPSVDGRLRV